MYNNIQAARRAPSPARRSERCFGGCSRSPWATAPTEVRRACRSPPRCSSSRRRRRWRRSGGRGSHMAELHTGRLHQQLLRSRAAGHRGVSSRRSLRAGRRPLSLRHRGRRSAPGVVCALGLALVVDGCGGGLESIARPWAPAVARSCSASGVPRFTVLLLMMIHGRCIWCAHTCNRSLLVVLWMCLSAACKGREQLLFDRSLTS